MPPPTTRPALAPRSTLGDRLDFLQRVAQVGLWEMRVRDRRLYVSDELRTLFGICADAPDPDFATLFARVQAWGLLSSVRDRCLVRIDPMRQAGRPVRRRRRERRPWSCIL